MPAMNPQEKTALIRRIREENLRRPIPGWPEVNATAGKLSDDELNSFARKAGIINTPTTREKTLEELRDELLPVTPFMQKAKVINGNLDELKQLAKSKNVSLELPIDVPIPEPRKMTVEEQEEYNRLVKEEEDEKVRQDEEKERQRAQKERMQLEKELAKQERERKIAEVEFNTTAPKTEQEAERRKEYLLYRDQAIQSLKERRELVHNRELEREGVERTARETNKANAEEQLKRLLAQQNAPREEVNKAVRAIEDANAAEISGSPRFIQEALKAKILLGIRELNKPYEPYLGQRIPDETPEQITAQIKLNELDPFQGETLREHEELKERVKNMPRNPAMRATERYLDSPNQTLLQTHRDLVGDEENEMERIYRQRALEHLEEDILPKIRDKYATPGVIAHGHQSRDQERAIRSYSRELNNSLNEMRLKNKQITVPAALQHQENKARKAQLAQNAGISDATHEIASTNALKALQDSHYAHKDKFAASLSRLGDVKQQKEAERLRLQEQEFNQRRGFDQTKLENFSNILAGHPVTKSKTSTGSMPGMVIQSPYSTSGQMMGSLGAQFMPRQQDYKKGGRVKKAIGGTLNPINPVQDAINWSVIDRESPMDELKRDVKRQRALGMMNMLKQRRAYAIGGGVSPIEVGAQIAEGVSYKEKLKRAKQKAFEQAERDQIQVEKPMLTDALETMSRAAARAETPSWMEPNWMQRMGKAVSGTFEDRNAKEDAFRKQRQDAIDRQLKMAEGEEKSERDLRDFGLKEKLGESTIAHHRAMEGIAAKNSNQVKPNITEKQQKEIRNLEDDALRTINFIKAAKQGKEAFSKVKGNQPLAAINSVLGEQAASKAGHLIGRKDVGSPEDIRAANAVTHKFIGAMNAMEGTNMRLNSVVKSIQSSKPEFGQEQAFNTSEFGGYEQMGKDDLEVTLEQMRYEGAPEERIEAIRKIYQREIEGNGARIPSEPSYLGSLKSVANDPRYLAEKKRRGL